MDIVKAVKLAQENNNEAIAYLYESTYQKSYYVAMKYMQNEQDAFDVVQDAYIKALGSLDQLDDPEKFSSWVGTIVAHKALDAKKKKTPTFFSETEDEESGADISDTFENDRVDVSPELAIDQKETSRLVNEMISDLTDEQRFCITMFYMEDMPVKEIAEVLGVSENTVKSRLNYGRNRIKDKVLELEKKGTKLYGLLPFAFFLALCKKEAMACEGTLPATETFMSALKASGQVVGKTISTKVVAICVASVIGVATIAGVGFAIMGIHNSSKDAATIEQVEETETEVVVEESEPEVEVEKDLVTDADYEEAFKDIIDNQKSLIGSTYETYVTSVLDEEMSANVGYDIILYRYSNKLKSGNLGNIYDNSHLITFDLDGANNTLKITSYQNSNDEIKVIDEETVEYFIPYGDYGYLNVGVTAIKDKNYIVIESKDTSSAWSDGTTYALELISYDQEGRLEIAFDEAVCGSDPYEEICALHSNFNSKFGLNYTQEAFENAFYSYSPIFADVEKIASISFDSDLHLLWDESAIWEENGNEAWSNKHAEYEEQFKTPNTTLYWGQGKIE